MAVLNRIQVKGFKSIREMDLELRPINVLIGANGSGKSNFLSTFELLQWMADRELQTYARTAGGANRLLYQGVTRENELFIRLDTDKYGYEARFVPSSDDTSLVFSDERIAGEDYTFRRSSEGFDPGKSFETQLLSNTYRYEGETVKAILDSIKQWQVYHFYDTTPVKRTNMVNNNVSLRQEAANLAPLLYLFMLRYPDSYKRIVQTIQLALPFFLDFALQPDRLNPESIRLEWRQKGTDIYFDAPSLSDGALRFICLTTLLLQPDPPSVIIIDEPELGLHPYALNLVASMIKSVSTKRQIIVATQSAALVDEFAPEDIIVVEREDNQSVFKRQSTKELEFWLEDYSLGKIWEKNVMGGTP